MSEETLFGMYKEDGDEPDDEALDAMVELLDKLLSGLDDVVASIERGMERFAVGTYWTWTSDDSIVHFHVVGQDVEDKTIEARAVRINDLSYGRRFTFEPSAKVTPTDLDYVQASTQAAFNEALNEALLAVQAMCDVERYGREE